MVIDDETKWCRRQIEQSKRDRGEHDWHCDCWIVCTDQCEREKQEWLEKKNSQN